MDKPDVSLYLGQEISGVAEHNIGEATEIKFHPNNMNEEGSFSLSSSWKPLIYALKEQKKCSLEGQGTCIHLSWPSCVTDLKGAFPHPSFPLACTDLYLLCTHPWL
jgi:hypothetical protein